MLGLRERVIAAICEEEWPHPDNEVNSTTIYERLKRDGDDASEDEVRFGRCYFNCQSTAMSLWCWNRAEAPVPSCMPWTRSCAHSSTPMPQGLRRAYSGRRSGAGGGSGADGCCSSRHRSCSVKRL